VWDQNAGMPVILRDSAGNRYVYGLDLISRTDSGGNQEYELSDGLGSTTGLADGTGAVTDTYTYDVYGAVRTHTGTSGNEFTFTGEQVDATGLQYLRARYYDAATGRFASRDPLPLMQRYAYAGGNPVNFVDPSGLDPGGKPTPVPLPAAGTEQSFATCKIGWARCVSGMAGREWARWTRQHPTEPRPLKVYTQVCDDFFQICLNEMRAGKRQVSFNEIGAKQRMRDMIVTGDSDWISDLINRIPKPHLQLPDQLPGTGSGGYLGRGKEGGGFGCLPGW
jgi:RHS repeat-associated protein